MGALRQFGKYAGGRNPLRRLMRLCSSFLGIEGNGLEDMFDGEAASFDANLVE